MRQVCCIAMILVGVLWYMWRYGTPADITFGNLAAYRHISPEHYDKAMEAARDFNRTRRAPSPNIKEMAAHLAIFSEHANELALLTPSADDIRASIEAAERSMHAFMEGARVRAGGEMVHEHPLPLMPDLLAIPASGSLDRETQTLF